MSQGQGVPGAASPAAVPYLGSKISLISKAEIRYEGTLYTIDPKEATVALAKVRSFGTEDRPTDRPLPARNEVFEFIIFRGLDIKDLHVCEPPKAVPTEGVPHDPAIVKSSQPPPGPAGAAFPGGPNFPPGAPVYQQFGQPMPYFGQGGPGGFSLPPPQGSESSTPPLNRKSPTSDQGVQVQPSSPEKSSGEGSHGQQGFHHQHSRGSHGPRRGSSSSGPHPAHRGGEHRGGDQPRMPQGDPRAATYSRGRSSNRGHVRGGGPPRGGGGQRNMRGQGQRGGRSAEPLKFDTEFDFESSNAQFAKDDIEKELKNLTISDKPSNGEKVSEEDPEVEDDNEVEQDEDDQEIYYDKKKSFFDNISCDATERNKGQRHSWREERKLNSETFGVSENFRRGYRGRGGWRGGNMRGGGGGWRGGRGGRQGGGRDGGFQRDQGYGGGYGGGGPRGGRGRRQGWDFDDRRRMDGPQRVEVRS